MKTAKWLSIGGALGLGLSVIATPAFSTTITAQLSGDGRPDNPDELFIDVTIELLGNMANWLIDLNSPLHSDMRLDEFYWNLADSVNTGNLTFSNYSPTDWQVTSPATTVGGGTFNPNFMFELTDLTGNPSNNPTNSISLSFTMTLDRDFTVDDFLNAPVSQSTDSALGGGQLGAHVQSLNADVCGGNDGCSDSGFVLGGYYNGGNPPDDEIPVPATVLLFGLGLGGLALRRRHA